jgi:hypothetical protein
MMPDNRDKRVPCQLKRFARKTLENWIFQLISVAQRENVSALSQSYGFESALKNAVK